MIRPEPWVPTLVALDLDGTLVGPEETVTPAVVEAVGRAAKASHVVIATGRSVHATEPVAAELGLTDGYLVCSNGAVLARLVGGASEIVNVTTFDARAAVALLLAELPDALFAVEQLGLAVGDHRNDLEMFGWAALAVAMGDAPPAVQDAADEVTYSWAEDGAAAVLTRYFPPPA